MCGGDILYTRVNLAGKVSMLVRSRRNCEECAAGDGSLLRELLHPEKADLEIRYSLAHAEVAVRQTTKPHRLRTCEVYYILEGNGLMHIDGQSSQVGAGDAIYIPPGSIQHIENTGSCALKFLCIVDPAWRREDEVVLSSEF